MNKLSSYAYSDASCSIQASTARGISEGCFLCNLNHQSTSDVLKKSKQLITNSCELVKPLINQGAYLKATGTNFSTHR